MVAEMIDCPFVVEVLLASSCRALTSSQLSFLFQTDGTHNARIRNCFLTAETAKVLLSQDGRIKKKENCTATASPFSQSSKSSKHDISSRTLFEIAQRRSARSRDPLALRLLTGMQPHFARLLSDVGLHLGLDALNSLTAPCPCSSSLFNIIILLLVRIVHLYHPPTTVSACNPIAFQKQPRHRQPKRLVHR